MYWKNIYISFIDIYIIKRYIVIKDISLNDIEVMEWREMMCWKLVN